MSSPAIVAAVAPLLGALPRVVDLTDLVHATATHVVCLTVIAGFVLIWAMFDRLVPKAATPCAALPACCPRDLPITVVEHFLMMQGTPQAVAQASENLTDMLEAGLKVVDASSFESAPLQIKGGATDLATFIEINNPETIKAARTLATAELAEHADGLISPQDCKQLMEKCNVGRKYTASTPAKLKKKGVLQIIEVNGMYFFVVIFKYPGCTGHTTFVNWIKKEFIPRADALVPL
jgi:hypothetical protein